MTLALSLKEKTGQMFIAGFEGSALGPSAEDLIVNHRVGGFILFERNFENTGQLFDLIRDMQELAVSLPGGQPLFISVDQEGGRVARLKKPFTDFPEACSLGFSQSEDLAFRFGRALAEELKAVGINMDYAPVLDVNTNPDNPVIGNRALSDKPETVALLGNAFIRAFRETGVIPVGKHFPGHGDTELDSHHDLPYVHRKADVLEEVELRPFIHNIQNGLEVLMTAHVIYSAWDEKYPATFSANILQKILRERLGFNGVLISDDLEMKAVAKHIPLESMPALGVNAGLDIFLICHDIEKIKALHDRLTSDMANAHIAAEKIDQALRRIADLKSRIGRLPKQGPDHSSWASAHEPVAEEMRTFLNA